MAAPKAVPVLLAPGQVLPPPDLTAPVRYSPRGTEVDRRNEWTKAEFPFGNQPCRWLPPGWRSNAGGQVVPGITTAQIAAQRREIQKVLDHLATAPVFNPPIDFCPIASSVGPEWPHEGKLFQDEGGGHALRASFMQGNWPVLDIQRSRPGGPLSFGEITHLIYRFNTIPTDFGGVSLDGYNAMEGNDDLGHFYSKPVPTGMFQGFPVYRERNLMIARNDRPVWRPVRRDRLLRWQIAQVSERLGLELRRVEEARRELAAMDTPEAQAAEERLIALRAERHYGGASGMARSRASREAELADTRAKLRDEINTALPTNRVFIETARKKLAEETLAGLTPAQAAAAGCLDTDERNKYITVAVEEVDHPNCRYDMVEANPDYFDKTLPREAIQLVVIARFPHNPPTGGLPAQRDMNFWANGYAVWGLDWQKFRREVLGGGEG